MASEKAPTEQQTESSTQPSGEEKIPAEMSFEQFYELLEKKPELSSKTQVQAVTYMDRPVWRPGEPVVEGEALRRRVSEIRSEAAREEMKARARAAIQAEAERMGLSPEEWSQRVADGTLPEEPAPE